MDIQHSPSGQIIKAPSGYNAFVPHPLPPKLTWDTELVSALSRADHILGKLAQEGGQLTNPHILIRPFVAREAVLSSKIEGIQTTVGEVLANEAGAQAERRQDELKEVQNYIRALDQGIKRLQEFPISLRLIKELHKTLMQGVRGEYATPGVFRNTQNWIGTAGCPLASAKYVPPTPEKLTECLYALEDYLHDRQLPALIHIALCHYQFEAIHPFVDGNGRVGRLLITLLLTVRDLLPTPLLYLSAFFEATRKEYYRQLYNVSALGSWNEWLIYFLNGVSTQAADVLSRAERINHLIVDWQIDVGNSASRLPLDLIKYLAMNPFVTTRKVIEHFGVAFTTAQRAIAKLESLFILHRVEGDKKRNRMYCATAILDILEETTNIPRIIE